MDPDRIPVLSDVQAHKLPVFVGSKMDGHLLWYTRRQTALLVEVDPEIRAEWWQDVHALCLSRVVDDLDLLDVEFHGFKPFKDQLRRIDTDVSVGGDLFVLV